MKKNLLLSALGILSLAFTSCSDDDDSNGSGPVDSKYFTVTINGTEKTFADVQGRWVDGGNFLEINGTNNGNEWVSITVLNETSRVPEGTYTLNDSSPYTILATYSLISDSGQTHYTATKNTLAPEDAFTLRIEDIDNNDTEGTFSGVLVNVSGETTLGTVTLQNGRFSTDIDPN